jgi:hypothetical protein
MDKEVNKNIKILKIEDHNYKIIYVNHNEKYKTYKRLSSTEWEEYSISKKTWVNIDDEHKIKELEKTLQDENSGVK